MKRDKEALRAELVVLLEQQLAQARASHTAAVEGAFHPEAKAENDKDTRGLELSYLARGHAQRVADLEVAVASVAALDLRAFGKADTVETGALVTVEDDDGKKIYFVMPGGSGATLGAVQVINPQAPLGRALLGKSVGESFELRVGTTVRELEVVAIA